MYSTACHWWEMNVADTSLSPWLGMSHQPGLLPSLVMPV